MYVFRLSCPSAAFPFQRGGFVPREWLAAKGLFSGVSSWEILIGAIGKCYKEEVVFDWSAVLSHSL